MSDKKRIPKFKSLEEEARFWDTHDSTDYIDLSKAQIIDFPEVKPTSVSISLRLPAWLLGRIKELASMKDVPYQSLMKVYLSERVEREIDKPRVIRYEVTYQGDTPIRSYKASTLTAALDAESIRRGEVDSLNNTNTLNVSEKF